MPPRIRDGQGGLSHGGRHGGGCGDPDSRTAPARDRTRRQRRSLPRRELVRAGIGNHRWRSHAGHSLAARSAASAAFAYDPVHRPGQRGAGPGFWLDEKPNRRKMEQARGDRAGLGLEMRGIDDVRKGTVSLLFGSLPPTLVWIWTLPQLATALAGGLVFLIIDRTISRNSSS